MNSDSEQIFKELSNLTQPKKIKFELYNHDDSSYLEPFYYSSYVYGKQLKVWSLLSIEARLKPMRPKMAIVSWKNLESEGTYYLNSCLPPYNTRLYYESESFPNEIVRGYQSVEEAENQSAKYQKLLNFLKKNCLQLTALEISDIGNGIKLYPASQKENVALYYYSTCILIGQINDRNWICLCPFAPVETIIDDSEFSYTPTISTSSESDYDSNTLEIHAQVSNILNELSPIQIYGCKDRESIFEHKVFCEIGQTEEDAVRRAFCRIGMLETGAFEGFYSNKKNFIEVVYADYYDDDFENPEDCYEVYQNLSSYLKNNLSNLTFYRYSLWIHEHIYIVGQNKSEDWLGVKLYSTYTDNP